MLRGAVHRLVDSPASPVQVERLATRREGVVDKLLLRRLAKLEDVLVRCSCLGLVAGPSSLACCRQKEDAHRESARQGHT